MGRGGDGVRHGDGEVEEGVVGGAVVGEGLLDGDLFA
jgi:hypothetical protein